MNVTENKAFAISVIFVLATVGWDIQYLSDGSYWEPIRYITEGISGDVFQYILSFILIVAMGMLEYQQVIIADEHDMLWLEIIMIPILWPLKWLLIAIVMSLPNCFI